MVTRVGKRYTPPANAEPPHIGLHEQGGEGWGLDPDRFHDWVTAHPIHLGGRYINPPAGRAPLRMYISKSNPPPPSATSPRGKPLAIFFCRLRTPSPMEGNHLKCSGHGRRVHFSPPLLTACTRGEASLLRTHWQGCILREGGWGHSRGVDPHPLPPPQGGAEVARYQPYPPTPATGHGGWGIQGGEG